LIAVIRRILVITIGDVNTSTAGPVAAQAAGGLDAQPMTLGVLTAIVLALVGSIVLLRGRSGRGDHGDQPQPDAPR
jgi:hypothetical protein